MKMIELVDKFPSQLLEALGIGSKANINKHTTAIRNVLISGMGGSGIGASFTYEMVKEELKVPFTIGKSYDIPKSVGKNTLAIVSSYSGNTEETLSSMEAMLKTGAKVVCVASGGKLIARAKELGLDYITLPAGSPSPRSCLGYSFIQQLSILNKLKLISNKVLKQVEGAAKLLAKDQAKIQKEAEKLADKLNGKIPIIYTTDRMESVAVRFRQQVNENSKALCWHHVLPEMNHNELVGWREKSDKWAAVFFRNTDDLPRNAVRMDITRDIIKGYAPTTIEVWSKGRNLVEKMLYFSFLGDYASCYLCDLRGFDSIEIDVIDHLKNELSKV